jgi:tetratricopeptide (TPR) repeat protein
MSRTALGAALLAAAVAGSGMAAPPPPTSPLSKAERANLLAAEAALEARNYAAAGPAISTAVSRAGSGYSRYLASSLQLKLALETNDRKLQASAIQAMIESGAAPTANLEELYKNQGALALAANETQKAEAAFDRWSEIAPNNPEALLALAEVKDDRGKMADSVALIGKAIDLQRAAGRPVPQSWYKRGLKQAFDAKLEAPSLALAQGLVRAYPTPENWRDALLIYRDLYRPEPAASLDAMRLLRSAKALSGERDYLEYAEAVGTDGGAGERKAVLDEGVSAKMIDPAKPAFKTMIAATGKKATTTKAGLAAIEKKATAAATGDAALAAGDSNFGYGNYAKAVELYRLAIAKGSVDANVANTRLGMALALTGQRAEAEAAFRAVTGPRSALASYWLLWVEQRGQAA